MERAEFGSSGDDGFDLMSLQEGLVVGCKDVSEDEFPCFAFLVWQEDDIEWGWLKMGVPAHVNYYYVLMSSMH